MGFKRTSEGRVFFSGASEASNDEKRFEEARAKKAVLTDQERPKAAASQQGGQLQVLSLLKSLNEKLQLSQIERNSMRRELDSYRKLVESLEEKSKITDEVYQDLQSRGSTDIDAVRKAEDVAAEAMAELAKTRAMMLKLEGRTERVDRNMNDLLGQAEKHKQVSVALSKKQVELERLYKEQSEIGAAKYQDLLGRVEKNESQFETAMAKQERFLTRLEQESQERARFMDRIEEKALMISGPEDMPGAVKGKVGTNDQRTAALLQPHPADRLVKSEAEDSAGRRFVGFWQQPLELSAPFVLILALGFLILGWSISDVQQPVLPDMNWKPNVTGSSATNAQDGAAAAQWENSTDVASFEDGQSSFDGLGLVNGADLPTEAELAAMGEAMDSNIDTIASALNAIEPGTPAVEAVVSAPAEEAAPSNEVPEAVEAPVQTDAQAEVAAAEKVAAVVVPRQVPVVPANRTVLPPEVQKIEALAQDGVAEAQHDLAAIFVTGHGGVEQDYSRAAYWFEQAAENGVANAAYNLGVLYHQGLGVPKDVNSAMRWYGAAAELGHPEAQYNLGIAYIEGIGVEYDPVAASLHFESAAQNGVTEAAYNLGLIYENGLLGAPRPDEALMWYKLAADAGSVEAKSALGQLAQSLNIEMEEIERVVNDVRAKRRGKAPVVSVPDKGTAAPVVTPARQSSRATVEAVAADVSGAGGLAAPAVVRQVQGFLMEAGLYPGPADGHMGPLTQDAIRTYQSMHKMNVNGQPSVDLLVHMQGTI